MTTTFTDIPAELKSRPQWVGWRVEAREGKPTKVPVNPGTGKNADPTDPATWGAFEAAAAGVAAGRWCGIGYVFSKDDPYCGIDFDKVIDPASGGIDPAAAAEIEGFGSYAEYSPSGAGAHVIVRGAVPGGKGRKKGNRECYDRSRFFTVTGRRLNAHPVADRQGVLDAWHARTFPKKKEKPDPEAGRRTPDLSDAGLLGKIGRSAQAPKFAALWAGDTSGYPSHSEADQALANILFWWANRDAARTDRLFRCSGLMRPKWDEARGAASYGANTVAAAEQMVEGGYDPDYRSGPKIKVGGTPEDGSRHPSSQTEAAAPQVAESATCEDQRAPATGIILAYFRERYRPDFRRGTAVHTPDGFVQMGEACAVPDSGLIARLAAAPDAPRYKGGGLNHNALPGHFRTWAKVAWGDLLKALPDEDGAALGAGSAAGETFRRMVRDAMLSEVVLGDVIGKDDVTRTERRSLIDWCVRFAKPGPWRGIRSKKCFTKVAVLGGGEIAIRVALRVELFPQLRADRTLCVMTQNTFAARAERYGVGASTRTDRPEGRAAVVLADDFVAELTEGIPLAADDVDVGLER